MYNIVHVSMKIYIMAVFCQVFFFVPDRGLLHEHVTLRKKIINKRLSVSFIFQREYIY